MQTALFQTSPVAESVPFDNSTNGFLSDNVQDAIEEAQNSPTDDNFSYYSVPTGETVIIKDGQEMIVSQDIMVSGDLIVRGILTQLNEVEESEDSGQSWTTIPVGTFVKVLANRLMFYRSPFLRVLGDLRVIGDLIEV